MKKYLCIATLLLFTSIAAISQPGSSINTSRSNVHRPSATYSAAGGLVLTFNGPGTTAADKLAIASGKFIVEEDITLTDAECKALKVTKGCTIKKGSYNIIKVKGIDTCKPDYAIKENGIK